MNNEATRYSHRPNGKERTRLYNQYIETGKFPDDYFSSLSKSAQHKIASSAQWLKEHNCTNLKQIKQDELDKVRKLTNKIDPILLPIFSSKKYTSSILETLENQIERIRSDEIESGKIKISQDINSWGELCYEVSRILSIIDNSRIKSIDSLLSVLCQKDKNTFLSNYKKYIGATTPEQDEILYIACLQLRWQIITLCITRALENNSAFDNPHSPDVEVAEDKRLIRECLFSKYYEKYIHLN